MAHDSASITRIAADEPALELSDGTLWEVPAGVSYMLIQTWTIGDEVDVEADPGGDFTHKLTNRDAEGDHVTTFARRIGEWPEESPGEGE